MEEIFEMVFNLWKNNGFFVEMGKYGLEGKNLQPIIEKKIKKGLRFAQIHRVDIQG